MMQNRQSVMTRRRRIYRATRAHQRQGSIVVLTAFLMIFLMALLAFSIDIGYMLNARVEIDRAVDAGALAGAGALIDGEDAAETAAREFVQHNHVAGRELTDEQITIQTGQWDKQTHSFSDDNGNAPFALRVRAERDDVRPMFFGRVFGRNEFGVAAEAVAMYQPRDIMLVLDYSASMSDDSELKSIPTLGQEAIVENLETMYEELGSPVYGTLSVEPKYLVVTGATPTNTYRPNIKVEYRYNSVYVTSTKAFHQIRCYRSSGSFTTYTGSGTWNASLGRYEQVVTYSSNQITQVDVKSGYNSSTVSTANQYSETFYFNTASVIRTHAKNYFGLNSVTYPYSSGGSWDGFIDYCRSNSYNSSAGYLYKFGYINLINYWQESYPSHSQVPDLWKTSEQPITALKNSVDVFLSFMTEVDTEDRLGLSVYNSTSGDAVLERQLGENFDEISTISRQRQAGHYSGNTNIGAGLRKAWEELDARGRAGSFKMIVLMTDGLANLPSPNPAAYLNTQVNTCVSKKYPIVTISLGNGADTTTLQNIADVTGGVHFVVPGGRDISEVEEDLRDVFRQIAEKRPLQLVQ